MLCCSGCDAPEMFCQSRGTSEECWEPKERANRAWRIEGSSHGAVHKITFVFPQKGVWKQESQIESGEIWRARSVCSHGHVGIRYMVVKDRKGEE